MPTLEQKRIAARAARIRAERNIADVDRMIAAEARRVYREETQQGILETQIEKARFNIGGRVASMSFDLRIAEAHGHDPQQLMKQWLDGVMNGGK